MKRLVRLMLSRTTLILLLLLLQFALFFVLVAYFSTLGNVHTILYVLSVIIVIFLVAKEDNPMYKLSWVVPILIFPVFGGLFYLFYKQRNLSPKVINRMRNARNARLSLASDLTGQTDKTRCYLGHQGYLSYGYETGDILESDPETLRRLVDDMRSAVTRIYLEYFIITDGVMWRTILPVLEEKAASGVDVRLIYDDFGSSTLPLKTVHRLRDKGIRAVAFNPMRMHINFAMNYRDHRKIVTIDDRIAYTGGMNIGDEYINLEQPFGHWADAMLRITGDAARSLSLTFHENWAFSTGETDIPQRPTDHVEPDPDGPITPFDDSPLDRELTTKNVFLSMISGAKETVLITTPYLIIDNELLTSLKLAAQSGVDVKIIIPHIPDKRLVLMVTESYIPELLESGVRIYRYTPGFIHSKLIITDNTSAVFGTANFDFRSLYLHFENSILINDRALVGKLATFAGKLLATSDEVMTLKKRNIIHRALQLLLRGFAPLL
jgi:cardiolipin synthase A/B